MGVLEAQGWYNKRSGDPDTGFISSQDAKNAIAQIYTDMGAGGTGILTGTTIPTPTTGNNGQFYLNTKDRVLYGPKATKSGSLFVNQNIVEVDLGPDFQNTMEGAPADILFGTKIVFGAPGKITALRYYRPEHKDPAITSSTLYLYNQTAIYDEYMFYQQLDEDILAGPPLAIATTSNESTEGWYTAVLNTPISVNARQAVYVTYPMMGQQYIAGVGIMEKVGVPPIQSNSMTWVASVFMGQIIPTAYIMSDLVFQTSWPVALTSLDVLTGAGEPQGSLGVNGDLYIDIQDSVLWGPKLAFPWMLTFFPANDEPASYNLHDLSIPQGCMFNTFYVEQQTTITHLRYYQPSEADPSITSIKLYLWIQSYDIASGSDILVSIAEVTINNVVTGWNQVALPQPMDMGGNYYNGSGNIFVGIDIPPNGYVSGNFSVDPDYGVEQGEQRGMLSLQGSYATLQNPTLIPAGELENSIIELPGRARIDAITGNYWIPMLEGYN